MNVGIIMYKLRHNERWRLKSNFLELQQTISALARASPFVGRILTQEKTYAGKIEKLALEDGFLKFTISDCGRAGEIDERSKTYRGKIPWEDLEDIQVSFNLTEVKNE